MDSVSTFIDGKTLAVIERVMLEIQREKNIDEISTSFSNKHDIECRILCCREDIDDLLLCLASFYVFSEYYLEIYIHEDGSFDETCIKLIKRVFPFVKIVPLVQASAILKKNASIGELYRRRNLLLNSFKFHVRLIDFPFLSTRSRILSMDSDCFFFGNPSELFESILSNQMYIHCQGRFFSHGNAEQILINIGFENRLNLIELPKPGAHLLVYPKQFYVDNFQLVSSFIDYLINFGTKWCDEQGFFDITLKNNFSEIALPEQSYVGTFWKNNTSLDLYDFDKNIDGIKLIHCASNEDFMILTKSKLVNLLQLYITR